MPQMGASVESKIYTITAFFRVVARLVPLSVHGVMTKCALQASSQAYQRAQTLDTDKTTRAKEHDYVVLTADNERTRALRGRWRGRQNNRGMGRLYATASQPVHADRLDQYRYLTGEGIRTVSPTPNHFR